MEVDIGQSRTGVGAETLPGPGRGLRVVLPFHGSAADIAPLVARIIEQLGDADELVVVDDASPRPITPELLGMCDRLSVLRFEQPRGPYAARNVGARTGDHVPETLVFVDGRCLPTSDWLRKLREASGPKRIVGGAVTIRRRSEAVARAAVELDMFARSSFEHPSWFLPFFPTCNLAVPYDVFIAAGGFEEVRGGADAGLCWRLQLDHGCEMAFADAEVNWGPRTGLVEWVEQWFRYGSSTGALYIKYRDRGAPHPQAHPARKLVIIAVATALRGRRTRDVRVLVSCLIAELAYWLGVRVTLIRESRYPTLTDSSAQSQE